ncbi:hypothetical protein WMY93_026070 [Mugilogobius chulae]|uniref:B30.2/SPRY domain-containing protein n=1 Tax=Mugilogobius chulae TaxID=88201 RepID=A0AAW0MY06_9GOBI
MGFKAWDKMRALVQYSPVFLDKNTANRWLYVSEDLRGVRNGDTKQQIPLNPERFTKYPRVLGSEGFSSGSHQWDVEVGDHPEWTIGLAKESVDRKGEITANPENGYWCFDLEDGEYIDVVGKTLKLKRSPQKIRVRLDYDEGKLFFYDAENMAHRTDRNKPPGPDLAPALGAAGPDRCRPGPGPGLGPGIGLGLARFGSD